jgi:hypothetical protein
MIISRTKLTFKTVVFLLIIFCSNLFATVKSFNHPNNKPIAKIESDHFQIMYNTLELQQAGLSKEAFDYAIKGFEKLKANKSLLKDSILSIIDFTKPSSQKRFFILDLNHQNLLFKTYVAHGQHSGLLYATAFSNRNTSFQSSLGFYQTATPYIGKHGYSLALSGFEKGFNDQIANRSIVIHGATYVSDDFINKNGYLGRSLGCPAVPQNQSESIINLIKGGSCLFVYAANSNYINSSKLLND